MKPGSRGRRWGRRPGGTGGICRRGGGVNRGVWRGFLGTGLRVLGKGSLLGERWAMALEKEAINN